MIMSPKTSFISLHLFYIGVVFIRLTSGLSFDRCPPTETAIAPADSPKASVVWAPPEVLGDNADIATSHDHTPGDKFPIGNTTVTYRAFNFTAISVFDTAICSFVVRVLDVNPPTILQCPFPMSLTLPHGLLSTSISWIEPTAIDNSGKVELNSTHRPADQFSQGETQVTYIAQDPSGNTATCAFNISLFSMTAEPTSKLETAEILNIGGEVNGTGAESSTVTDSMDLTPTPSAVSTGIYGSHFQNMKPMWKGKLGSLPKKPLSSVLPPKDTKGNGYPSFVNSPTIHNMDIFMHRNARVIEISCITFISLFLVAAVILIVFYNKTIMQTLRLRHERKRTGFPTTSWEQCPQMEGINDPLLLKEYNDYPRRSVDGGDHSTPTLQPGEVLPLIAGGASTRIGRAK